MFLGKVIEVDFVFVHHFSPNSRAFFTTALRGYKPNVFVATSGIYLQVFEETLILLVFFEKKMEKSMRPGLIDMEKHCLVEG